MAHVSPGESNTQSEVAVAMETRTRVALGLAGGYLLGRFRKARWLLALAAVGSSPEVRKLIGQGREAVVGALHTGMEGLTERIHATTESLRADGHKPAEGEPEEAAAKEEPEAEAKEEPEGEAEEEPEGEAEEEPQAEAEEEPEAETEEKPEAEAEDEPKAEEEPEKPADEESDTAASDVKPPGGAPAHKETAAAEEASAEATGNPPDRDRRGQGGSGDDHSRRSPSARVSGRPTGVRGRR